MTSAKWLPACWQTTPSSTVGSPDAVSRARRDPRTASVLLSATGGATGLRDLAALESAAAQPQLTFDAEDLYATLAEKAASLGYSLVRNHPFVDGNKRIAHAAMAVFLELNGAAISADIDAQEQLMLGLAAGTISRGDLVEWLDDHVRPRPPAP